MKTRVLSLLAFLACLAVSSAALAQSTPRVLVIFDTSGSMLWDYQGNVDCRGDGSARYPHRNGCNLGSRMFHAKQALSQIINATPGTEFGLMRYGQLETGQAGFGTRQLQVGAQYYNDNGQVVATNYDGVTNGCAPANLLVDPSPASRAPVLRYMDGSESYPNDKELRGNGYTPLTQSMDSARDALVRLLSNDVEADCRPYYVLLLTDGYQQCPNEDASDAAVRARVANELRSKAEGLRDLRIMGQRHDVRTFVVGFGPGTAFATELDGMARAGGTAVNAAGRIDLMNGTAYQANDPAGLVAALGAAIGNAGGQELCDGEDNDCDGRTDEGFANLGRACNVGQGACGRDGTVQCAPDGQGTICSARPGDAAAELCNGRDDDCDGRVDEGAINRCGECGAEPAEACNGRDDDCDGAIDEGTVNDCGACGRLPIEVCNGQDDDCDGRTDEGVQNACGACGAVAVEVCNCQDDDCDLTIDEGLNCPVCDCVPVLTETCDGTDDDCDGRIDEGSFNACGQCGVVPEEICNGLDDDCDGNQDEDYPERGQPCGEPLGVCTQGTFRCVDGRLACGGGTAPSQEICDTLDNDCDGRADEDAENACGWCGPPRIEVCDNIDNDCDGTDDVASAAGPLCRDINACINGECAPPCENGECFGGRVCVTGHCVTTCRNTECPDGWVCQDGQCDDPCVGIQCPTATYCTLGHCVPEDCYGPRGCPQGQFCADGACVPDACANAGCGPDQGCVDGRCFDACANVRCTGGTICFNGECVADPCSRVACTYPAACVDGSCVDDPCFEQECPVGFVCAGGDCIEDPCLRVTCPGGALCHRGRCADPGSGQGVYEDPADPGTPRADAGPAADAGPGAAADDGCYCDLGHSRAPTPLASLVLLALVGLRRRRR